MYTHSYQSYVWNSVVTERLDKYSPDKPIIGDLVIAQDAAVAEDYVAEDGDESGAAAADADTEPATKKQRSASDAVVVITTDNIGQYSIYDVVLPLPGYDIVYPQNELKQRYDELLAADGVDFSSLLRSTNSEYHLPGSFRHILKKPIDVTHEIKRYNDPTLPLLSTDVDILMNKPTPTSVPDGAYRALCLEFQLSKSVHPA